MNRIVLSPESAKAARLNMRQSNNPTDVLFVQFVLPDGQILNWGCLNKKAPKQRIGEDGVWDFCRKNIKAKLIKSIKENKVSRVKFLVKCLNVVQDDHHFCNFINGFNDSMESKKISYQEFVEKYQDRILNSENKGE